MAVTVDVRGYVVDVRLTDGAYREYQPDALACCLVDLAGRAVASLTEHYSARAALAVGR